MARQRNPGGQSQQLSPWERLARDMADLRQAILAQSQAARAGGAPAGAVRQSTQAAAAFQAAARAALNANQASGGPLAQAVAQAAVRAAQVAANRLNILNPGAPGQNLAGAAQAAAGRAAGLAPGGGGGGPSGGPLQQLLQQLQASAAQSHLRAQMLATPQAQQALGVSAVAGVQAGAAQSRARAAALFAPQGQQALKEAARAREMEQFAVEQSAGKFAALGKALGPVAVGMTAFNAAVSAAEATMFNLAGKASPNTRGTFNESIDLLLAKIGAAFVPFAEAASGLAQYLARGVGSYTVEERQSPARKIITNAIVPAFAAAQAGLEKFFGVKPEAPKRSLEGLPKAQNMAYEQFTEQAQLRALNTSDLEMDRLKEALENLTAVMKAAAEGGRPPPSAPGLPRH